MVGCWNDELVLIIGLVLIIRGYQIYQIHNWEPVNYPKIFFFINGSKIVRDEQPAGFKNGGFLKTSQLHKCGFAYI
jgi:hypothetical protein